MNITPQHQRGPGMSTFASPFAPLSIPAPGSSRRRKIEEESPGCRPKQVTTGAPLALPENDDTVSPTKRYRSATASGIPKSSPGRQLKTLDSLIDAGYSMSSPSFGTSTVEANPVDLGVGGFSKVKLAKHILTGKKVAVKVMDKKKLGHDAPRVKTEILALKTLRGHPSICRLYQVIETAEKYYLVLELLEGGELFDYIVSKTRLTESEAAGIIRQLLHALNYMHSRGFAHRDLKPENVLIASRSKSSCSCSVPLVKLIDFGLCANDQTASLSDGSRTGITALQTCCGSPSYAAPELLSSGVSTYSGPLVDVWSLGVVAFAIMIGKLPFDHDNLGVLYKQIKGGLKPGQLPVWLTLDAKSFLQECLVVDPKGRSTVDRLLNHPFITKYPFGCKSPSCRFKELSSNGKEILIQNLDEMALAKVISMFPEVNSKVIRSKIRTHGLDYVSSTYFLMKEELAREEAEKDEKKSLWDQNMTKNSPVVPRPSVVATKRKSLVPADYKPSPVYTVNRPPRVPVRRLAGRVATPPTSSDRRRAVANRRDSSCPPASGTTPVTASQNRRESLALSGNRRNPLSPTNRGVMSPSLALSPRPVKEAPVKPFVKDCNLTSVEQSCPSTPKTNKKTKSSLFRRLLDSVSSSAKKRPASDSTVDGTPSSLSSCRWIKDTRDAKNIVCMSSFSDPKEAVCSLEGVLKSVGIEVASTRKNHPYLLSCVKKSARGDEVRFVLEVCFVGNEKSLCIQRRRLRGSSWQYKVVCEQILILCNNISSNAGNDTTKNVSSDV